MLSSKQLELQNTFDEQEHPFRDDDEEPQNQNSYKEVAVAIIDEAGEDQANKDLTKFNKINFKRHFGNSWVGFFVQKEPLITIGPHWPLSVAMIALFGIPSYLLLRYLVPTLSLSLQFVSWTIAVLQMISYVVCALKNPGIVSAKQYIEINVRFQCTVCRVTQTDGVVHCDDCNVCIKGMDHHCPWTGKCIGQGNIFYFYVFVIMIPLYFVYFIAVVIPLTS